RAVMEFCYDVESKIMSINSQASHYDVLELSSYATPTELQNAFTRLLKNFHPERNTQLSEYQVDLRVELNLIMERLTEAINVLSNPRTRDLYDKELSRPFNTPPQAAL